MADESEVVSVMRMGWTEEEGDDVEIITIRRLAMIAIAWCVFSHRSLTEEKNLGSEIIRCHREDRLTRSSNS